MYPVHVSSNHQQTVGGEMTTTEHKIAVKFEVYHDEMNDIVKLFNRALDSDNVTKHFSNEELGTIISFVDDFKTLALNHAN